MKPTTPQPDHPKVVVLMPAYRAGQRVIDTFYKIPLNLVDEVIVVDDASPDDTYTYAKTLPAQVFRNEHNLGYGGNLKVCLQKGLAAGGDILVELHADGQYDPRVLPEVLQKLRATDGLLLGSRLMQKGQAVTHGMSQLKYV